MTKWIVALCFVVLAAGCKKAIEPETRISNRTVYKQVPDAKPYASLWLSTELLEQFNWQQQVPVMKGDSLIAVKVLHRNLTGSTLQYLILHIEYGVYSKAVHHQIEFEGVVGKSKALSLTSKNLVSGDIATWRNDVKDTEDRTTLRANTRKYSTEYSPSATTLPMVTVTAKYRQGSLVTFTPMTFVLVNGAFAAATPSGDIINNYTPYQDLAYLEPADTPESGTAATEYSYSTNRMLNGIWYSIDDHPNMEIGFPWLWWENEDWLDNNFTFGDDDQDGVYDRLTPEEKRLIKLYPMEALAINSNRKKAEERTKELFGYNGLNDKSDAFRHAYWQALNERDCGKDIYSLQSIAKLFADAHEELTPPLLQLEKEMDLWNNQIGLNEGEVIFPILTSDSYLSDKIYEKLLSGNLRYLKPIKPPMYDPKNGQVINPSGDPHFYGASGTRDLSTATHGIMPGITLLTPTNQ